MPAAFGPLGWADAHPSASRQPTVAKAAHRVGTGYMHTILTTPIVPT